VALYASKETFTKESFSRFQLIAATSRDMEQAVVDGSIIIDLRMRLYGIEIDIPPLRERLDQIADFIDWFFVKLDKPYELSSQERQNLIQRCSEFYWQGNVRQLFGVLQVLTIHAAINHEAIRASRLPVYQSMHAPGSAMARLPGGEEVKSKWMKEAYALLLDFEKKPFNLEKLTSEIEKAAIQVSVEHFESIKDACEALEVPRSTLDARRRKLGILGGG
jgi:DNA-binding NtrC family response regulator